uniref:Uncharacterized protein n=1 Tax=Octactis speculum TaxID=3111310 RepID=A0A7S2FJY0_9STRA
MKLSFISITFLSCMVTGEQMEAPHLQDRGKTGIYLRAKQYINGNGASASCTWTNKYLCHLNTGCSWDDSAGECVDQGTETACEDYNGGWLGSCGLGDCGEGSDCCKGMGWSGGMGCFCDTCDR